MYAIIKTGGKQHKVSAGDVLAIEKISGDKGDSVVFEEVLMVAKIFDALYESARIGRSVPIQ